MFLLNLSSYIYFFLFFITVPAGWPSARTLSRHGLPSSALTPRALQVHTTDSLSENLKTQDGASAAGGAPTLKSVTRTPKNWEKTMLYRAVLKCTQPKTMSCNERTSAYSVKFTFIPRFFFSPSSYALDAWLASNPARVIIRAGATGSTQPYTCHHLSGVTWASFLCSIQPYTCHHLGWGNR